MFEKVHAVVRLFFTTLFCAALVSGSIFGQSIAHKDIVGNVFSSEFLVSATIDTVMNRLGDMDFLATVMGYANRGGPSKRFERVGDCAMFIPYYKADGGDYGIVMLTYCKPHSELRFVYQSMNGEAFFQDRYFLTRVDDSTVKIVFAKRFTGAQTQSSEFVAARKARIEESLARLKKMMEMNRQRR